MSQAQVVAKKQTAPTPGGNPFEDIHADFSTLSTAQLAEIAAITGCTLKDGMLDVNDQVATQLRAFATQFKAGDTSFLPSSQTASGPVTRQVIAGRAAAAANARGGRN